VNRFRFLFDLLTFALFVPVAFAATASNDSFSQALESYRAGRFVDAAKDFRVAAQRHPASGTFVNLGLTEWRRGRAGLAVLAWEQALWVNPFDASARANLAYARQLIAIESPDLTWYERASTWLPVNAWAWIAGCSLWVAIAMVVLPGVFRWRKAGWQQAFAALALTIFFASLPAHLGVLTRTTIGFVLQKETPLRLTPTSEAESTVKLPAGEPARQLRQRGNFVLVKTARGQGWVHQEQFGRVCPN
jgi:hypothetical protein